MVELRVVIGPRENVLVGYFDVLFGEERHLEVSSLLCRTIHSTSSCANLILYLQLGPGQLTVFDRRNSCYIVSPNASAGTITEIGTSIAEHEALQSFFTGSLWVAVLGRQGTRRRC